MTESKEIEKGIFKLKEDKYIKDEISLSCSNMHSGDDIFFTKSDIDDLIYCLNEMKDSVAIDSIEALKYQATECKISLNPYNVEYRILKERL